MLIKNIWFILWVRRLIIMSYILLLFVRRIDWLLVSDINFGGRVHLNITGLSKFCLLNIWIFDIFTSDSDSGFLNNKMLFWRTPKSWFSVHISEIWLIRWFWITITLQIKSRSILYRDLSWEKHQTLRCWSSDSTLKLSAFCHLVVKLTKYQSYLVGCPLL